MCSVTLVASRSERKSIRTERKSHNRTTLRTSRKRRHKRISFIVTALTGFAIAAGLVLSAFRNNLVFFFSPSQVVAKEATSGKTFRIGGLVEQGSLKRDSDGLTTRFTVTDTAKNVPVVYWYIKGFCWTCSKRAAVVSLKVAWAVTESFSGIMYWRNTTRITCHLKPAKLSTTRKPARLWSISEIFVYWSMSSFSHIPAQVFPRIISRLKTSAYAN